jgi:hypothetical protein
MHYIVVVCFLTKFDVITDVKMVSVPCIDQNYMHFKTVVESYACFVVREHVKCCSCCCF